MDPEMSLIASGSNEDLLKKGKAGDFERLMCKFFIFSENESKQLKKVKLVSADGIEFEIDYNCACQSGTIKDLLESSTSKQ